MATESRAWYQTIGSKIWYFFNSLKLTIAVLITLAAVSIIGTVIEQNKPIETYLTAYGEEWTRFILYTGLNNMYHSWWFLALMGALTLNIIVCTFERFPPKWKSLKHHIPSSFEPRLIEKLAHNHTVRMDGKLDAAEARLFDSLKSKKYKVTEIESGSGDGKCYYAWKGKIGRYGSDIVHISLLLILLGAIVGGVYGYKDFKAVYVGGMMKVPQADFQVRLDKFWIDYYDTGQVRQYNSLLTVVENGKDVYQKQIWVNEPMYYKGIRFYQSTFGKAWNRLEAAQVSLVNTSTDKLYPPVEVKWGELTEVPESPYKVKLVGYTADFAYDERTSTVFSKSPEPENPAINLEIYNGDKLLSTPWLFLNYPGIFPAIPDSDKDIVFRGLKGIMYSGISLNKDPGTNIVWLGTGVMGLGFFLAFFVFHRRVWIHLRNNGGSTEVRLGGLINKNNFVLEKDLEAIVEGVTAGEDQSAPEGNE